MTEKTPRVLDEDSEVRLRFAAFLGGQRYSRGVHPLPAGTTLPRDAVVLEDKEAKAEKVKAFVEPKPEPDTLHAMTPKKGKAV